jgi:hypothetical protein
MTLNLNKFQKRTVNDLCNKILDALPSELVKHVKEDAVGLVQYTEDKWRRRNLHNRLMREIRFTGLGQDIRPWWYQRGDHPHLLRVINLTVEQQSFQVVLTNGYGYWLPSKRSHPRTFHHSYHMKYCFPIEWRERMAELPKRDRRKAFEDSLEYINIWFEIYPNIDYAINKSKCQYRQSVIARQIKQSKMTRHGRSSIPVQRRGRV